MNTIHQKHEQILDYLKEHGSRTSLSIDEVQMTLGFDDTQEVVDHLQSLEKRGYTRKNIDTGGYTAFDVPVDYTIDIPVYGTALCGHKGSAVVDEYAQETMTFPTSLIGGVPADYSDYFFVRAKGDSMLPYIEDGDMVLIRRYKIGREVDKKILVAHNGVLKVKIIQKNNNKFFLFSSNAEKLEILNTDDVSVIGYVAKVIKDM